MDFKITKRQNVSSQCIVCGIHNAASLRAQFLETKGGILLGVPTAQNAHQGFPNRMHGGVIAALLDEVIGRAVQISEPETWGVTGRLELKYIKPVPLDSQIYAAGRVTRSAARIFEGEGKIYLAKTGELLASAAATYIKLPVEKIADADFLHTQWFAETRPFPDLSHFVLPPSDF